MAAPPRDERQESHFHTPRSRAGFGFGEGVGVEVGSFGHVRGEHRGARRCSEPQIVGVAPVTSAAPVQPVVIQPVVTQPAFGVVPQASDRRTVCEGGSN